MPLKLLERLRRLVAATRRTRAPRTAPRAHSRHCARPAPAAARSRRAPLSRSLTSKAMPSGCRLEPAREATARADRSGCRSIASSATLCASAARLLIVEIEHRRLRLGDEVAEQRPQLVHRSCGRARCCSATAIVGREQRDRAVAFVDFADEGIASRRPPRWRTAHPRVTKFFITAPFMIVGSRPACVQDPADHAGRRRLAAGAADADAAAARR